VGAAGGANTVSLGLSSQTGPVEDCRWFRLSTAPVGGSKWGGWWQLFTLVYAMGKASRRKRQAAGDLIKVRRSDLTGKWAVDLDLPGQSHRLDVFVLREDAEVDAKIARDVFGPFSPKELLCNDKYRDVFLQYANRAMAEGPESDDEIISRMQTMEDGTLLIDVRRQSLDQENARLREFGLLSDRIWNRGRKA